LSARSASPREDVARPRISRDRQTLRELYASDWKAWFAEEGDPRHGTPEDPRIALIGVDVQAAEFLEVNKPKPVIYFDLRRGGSPEPSRTSARSMNSI
jgi:hypothetical protein